MIQANELRIGNLFHPCSTMGGITIPNTEIFWKVGAIDKFGKVSVIEFDQPENIYLPINECAEIPLDESWLIRAGAEKESKENEIYTQWYVLNGLRICHVEAAIKPKPLYLVKKECVVFEIEADIQICHISHVHQLQNLFFALTGTELEFKDAPNP